MRTLQKTAFFPGYISRESTITPGRLEAVPGQDLKNISAWKSAFREKRKDHRYYEIVEDTICPEFDYRYFLVKDDGGRILAIQPFFILDQDLLAGLPKTWLRLAESVRRYWPRFLKLRTLMVGCAAGEGHLDATSDFSKTQAAEILSAGLTHHARKMKAALVVLKEFPASYRHHMAGFVRNGFSRIPSMPMTRLDISQFASLDEYLQKGLDKKKRKDLLRKYNIAARSGKIEMEMVSDIYPIIDDIYPLYKQVLSKSELQFEVLTKDYFLALSDTMSESVRYFVWRLDGKIIAFSLCFIEGTTMYGEYLGLDYSIAYKVNLYFVVMRDMISWAISNRFKAIVSTSLGYPAKYQMGHVLEPLDLYVRHTSPVINAVMRQLLPYLEPTRSDAALKKFSNYQNLWAA